jgi:hypothetical protein
MEERLVLTLVMGSRPHSISSFPVCSVLSAGDPELKHPVTILLKKKDKADRHSSKNKS